MVEERKGDAAAGAAEKQGVQAAQEAVAKAVPVVVLEEDDDFEEFEQDGKYIETFTDGLTD